MTIRLQDKVHVRRKSFSPVSATTMEISGGLSRDAASAGPGCSTYVRFLCCFSLRSLSNNGQPLALEQCTPYKLAKSMLRVGWTTSRLRVPYNTMQCPYSTQPRVARMNTEVVVCATLLGVAHTLFPTLRPHVCSAPRNRGIPSQRFKPVFTSANAFLFELSRLLQY